MITVNTADVDESATVDGLDGSDTLQLADATLDLSSTTLTSIDLIRGTTAANVITVNTADVDESATVDGLDGSDTLQLADATLDLSSTTLTSIELIRGTTAANVITVNTADVDESATVDGLDGNDTLQLADATLDLSSTTLTSIELIRGTTAANVITVNTADVDRKSVV